jgi:hypothetical protein
MYYGALGVNLPNSIKCQWRNLAHAGAFESASWESLNEWICTTHGTTLYLLLNTKDVFTVLKP